METERLRQFCVLAETSSFSRAAELLGITHSGLSKSIRTLEAEVGRKLVIAAGRGIAITDDGHELYRKSQSILTAVADLQRTEQNAPGHRLVRVGASEIFTLHLIGQLIEERFPDHEFEIHEMNPGELETSILERRVDFGLTFIPAPVGGIEHLAIGKAAMAVYSRKASYQNRPLSEWPFVAPSGGVSFNPLGIKERDGWPAELGARYLKYRTNLLSTALDLARRGLAVVYIPDFVAVFFNAMLPPAQRLDRLSLPKKVAKPERTIFVVKRSNAEESPELKRLIAYLRLAVRTAHEAG